MAIIFKLLWLFLRSLERGGVSELGLAQCEDSFPMTKTKRTVTPVSIVYWKQGVSIIMRKFGEGSGRKKKERCLQQRTSGRFTTRTEDLCTVQQKAIVQCPLVGSWGRQNLGQNEACWVAPALSARDSHAALFSLIVVLNRNTLAPSTIWSTERGR